MFTARYVLHSAYTVYLCVLCGSEKKTAIISLYSIDWLVFVTETECVYCAVRTGSLLYVFGLIYSSFDPKPFYVGFLIDK